MCYINSRFTYLLTYLLTYLHKEGSPTLPFPSSISPLISLFSYSRLVSSRPLSSFSLLNPPTGGVGNGLDHQPGLVLNASVHFTAGAQNTF